MRTIKIITLLACVMSSLNSLAQSSYSYTSFLYFPTSSSQIENYDGVQPLVSFSIDYGSFFPMSITENGAKVVSASSYKEVERWDEKSWEKTHDASFDYKNGECYNGGYKLISGFPLGNESLSVLNAKGASSKEDILHYEYSYERDSQGRVTTIIVNRYRETEFVFKYTYCASTEHIKSIKGYDKNLKLQYTIEYNYDNDFHLIQLLKIEEDATKQSIEWILKYNANGNPITVYYSAYKDYKNKRIPIDSRLLCQIEYEYLNGAIVKCKVSGSRNISWIFINDDKGNWVEKIKQEGNYRTRETRKLSYS